MSPWWEPWKALHDQAIVEAQAQGALRCCYGDRTCAHPAGETHVYCPHHGCLVAGYPGQGVHASRCDTDSVWWRHVLHVLTGWGRPRWAPHPEIVAQMQRARPRRAPLDTQA